MIICYTASQWWDRGASINGKLVLSVGNASDANCFSSLSVYACLPLLLHQCLSPVSVSSLCQLCYSLEFSGWSCMVAKLSLLVPNLWLPTLRVRCYCMALADIGKYILSEGKRTNIVSVHYMLLHKSPNLLHHAEKSVCIMRTNITL